VKANGTSQPLRLRFAQPQRNSTSPYVGPDMRPTAPTNAKNQPLGEVPAGAGYDL